MKPLVAKFRGRQGFSLVEAVLSIGIMSFGFLALVPLLALGLTGSRAAHQNRLTSQIAATYIEEAKQGNYAAGNLYLDASGASCPASQAAYVVQETVTPVNDSTGAPGLLNKLSLTVSPRLSSGSKQVYVELVPQP